jgi:hypothetical protein
MVIVRRRIVAITAIILDPGCVQNRTDPGQGIVECHGKEDGAASTHCQIADSEGAQAAGIVVR